MICSLCPHRCGALRDHDHGEGICRAPALPKLARAALHFGEEPCISGTNGSGTVFFSECTLSCIFCQNRRISRDGFGEIISVDALADIFRRLVDQGAHNINLVTPTHYAHAVRSALERYRPPVPVVYNSSGYESVNTLRSLHGLIDIYLPDFKYADDTLAQTFSGIPRYRDTTIAAIEEMLSQTGHLQINEQGLAIGGTMIRHMILPAHTKNSIDVLHLCKDRFGTQTAISLLGQYTPVDTFAWRELNRRITPREYQKVFDVMCELGFENGYAQELSGDTDTWIPTFDLTGIKKALCE